jgi:replicative DNA helicase
MCNIFFSKEAGILYGFNTRSKDSGKVKISLTLNILDHFVYFVFSENANVTKKSILKLRELFKIMDESQYENDRSLQVRIFLIKKLLEGYLDKGIIDKRTLAEYCLGGQYDEDVNEIFNEIDEYNIELSNDQVNFVENYVSERLNYAYIYTYQDELDQHLIKLRSADFNSLSDFNSQFKNTIERLYADIKKAENNSQHCSKDFGTDHESLDLAMSHTIKNLNRPSNTLKTGIKYFNKCLSGGWQGGRAYLILGVPKGWKSGMLLNTAIWAKKYNKNIVTNDPTKKPCVLYVSQENSIDETIERLWSYYIGEETNVKDYSTEEAIKMIEEAGFNEEDGIAIKIKYRPNKSINTAELDAMIDDVAMEGYECIMLVHDYIKRIRSVDRHLELRLELGAVMDELTVIAKSRGIPVITASQLNRNAIKIMETAISKGKSNVFKHIGASDIGESQLMLENADYVFIVGREKRESTGNNYLTVKMVASRGKEGNDVINYFSHPFENGMRLQEDADLSKSLSLRDISDDLANFESSGSEAVYDEEGLEIGTRKARTPQGKKRAPNLVPVQTVESSSSIFDDEDEG